MAHYERPRYDDKGYVICSKRSARWLRTMFYNLADYSFELYWIGYSCEPLYYDTIPTGMLLVRD